MSNWTIIFRASGLALLLGGSALAQAPIEVQSLDALDPLEVGLPDAAMGIALWDGSDLDMASQVLTRLPTADGAGYASPAVAELARSVLSSGGYPPAGGRGDQALPVLRADRLLAAGGVFEAYDLLERTPNLNQNEPLSRLHAELAFASGNTRNACHTANALLRGREQAYWLRSRAFCLALDGQDSAAELTAELARNASDDAGYDTMLFAITLHGESPATMPVIDSGLKLAMAHRLGSDAGVDDLDVTGAPGWLQRFVHGRAAPAPVPASDPATALAAALVLPGLERTAALEAVLVQGVDRELAAAALSGLLDDAVSAHAFAAAARAYGGEVHTLPVTRTTLSDGYRFALAALLSGDVRTASQWRGALMDGPPQPPAPAFDETGKPLDPFLDNPVTEAPSAWVPPAPRRMVNLDLAIAIARDRLATDQTSALLGAHLEAYGAVALPDMLALNRLGAGEAAGLRLALLQRSAIPVGPEVLAMEAAARANARAEAAILAISALAATQPNAETLSRAAAVLDQLGLRRAALNLLLERLVARAV
ncbi:hypothetical protein [uncultured Maricaulis sp.]|uniref:hypothetical protein n=1 Tax=uncultured Maricaulis sp. TaxID=174710 RepID=UPI0030DA226B